MLHGLRTRPGQTEAGSRSLEQDVDVLAERLSTTAIQDSTTSTIVTHPGPEDTLPRSVVWDDLSYAVENSKPSQQTDFESLVHRRKWSEFGGYSTIKKRVHQAVHWPLSNPETFKRMGVKPPMGLLLYGPSGMSSTVLLLRFFFCFLRSRN